jgi:hypothetical protein
VSIIVNRYQSGDLQAAVASLTNGTIPVTFSVQEPFNHSNVALSAIERFVLVTAPSGCREQSPCDTQPVLVAYDSENNVILKLGSNERPWQVRATIVGQVGQEPVNAVADYINGQTRYQGFGLPQTGNYRVQFTFIQPDGVSR